MARMPLPPFRHATLRVVPFKHEGKDVFLVADQHEGLFDHQIVLPPFAFVVSQYLDGEKEAEEVRKAILGDFPKVDLKVEDVEAVVRDLDDHYLLESDRVRARRREIEEGFLRSPVRPSKFVAGGREEVAGRIEAYYAAELGAGKPAGRREGGLAGVVAPHIDFQRGGYCYTHAYREIAERADAELFVVLGVAHLSPPNPFVVTAKGYETPFGVAEADREALAALEKRLGEGIFDNEAVHRAEHSAEFQAVFLKHSLPETPFTILPILCSSFEPHCGAASPSTVARIEDFLGALREAVAGRKACLVAGVDFAHVGPVFGDRVEVNDKLVKWMVEGDEKALRAAGEGNAEGFWNAVMADGNARHVCGLSATYAFLRLLDGAEGKLHKYGFAPDPAGGIVSFASLSFAPRPRTVVP
jgi:hypothetical protein